LTVRAAKEKQVRVMTNQIKRLKATLHGVIVRLLKIPVVQLIFHTVEGAGNHDAAQRAAGVAYYAILSIFPLLLGLIAVFGFFLPSVNLQDELLKFVGDSIPGATNILEQNIASIIELRGPMGILSLVVLFWGASAMFGAISLAINRAWDIRRYRPFFIRKASELGMALSTCVLFLLSLGVSTITAILRGVFDLPVAKLTIVDVGARLVAFLLMFVVFLLLYKLVPNTKTYWRDVWPGAILSAIFFEIARTLFIIYIENFANYQLIFGSITSIIALLVWTYYSAFILILGAEFSFQYSRMRYSVATENIIDK
jgi:membrane protein